jgi:hypothetical protein
MKAFYLAVLLSVASVSASVPINFIFDLKPAPSVRSLPREVRLAGTKPDPNAGGDSGLEFRITTDQQRYGALSNVIQVPITGIRVHYFDPACYTGTNEVRRFLEAALQTGGGHTRTSIFWAHLEGAPTIEATVHYQDGKMGKWLLFWNGQLSAYQDGDKKWWFTSWPSAKRLPELPPAPPGAAEDLGQSP